MQLRIVELHSETKYVNTEWKTVYGIEKKTDLGKWDRVWFPESCNVWATPEDCRYVITNNPDNFRNAELKHFEDDPEITKTVVEEITV